MKRLVHAPAVYKGLTANCYGWDRAHRKYVDNPIIHFSCGVVLLLWTTLVKCLSGLCTRHSTFHYL